MINRTMISAELLRVAEDDNKYFANDIIDEKVKDIEISISSRSVNSYNADNIIAVDYDCIGLTKDTDVEKGMYITDGGVKYSVQSVQASKRFNQIFLKAVE